MSGDGNTVLDIRGRLTHANTILDDVESNAGGGDDGGDGLVLEPRVAKLEASVEHIQSDVSDIKTEIRAIRSKQETDFRVLFGALIAVALGLAGLMAKGFGWL